MLAAQGLTARRGDATLFSGLGFAVQSGKVLVVTGPNGTGKTTLLRILAGLTLPAAGTIQWRGETVAQHAAPLREETLYAGHLTALKDELTAEENLRSLVSLSGIEPDEAALRAALASVALEAQRMLPARVLSQGQRRRIGLARLSLLAAAAVAARRAGDRAGRDRARPARAPDCAATGGGRRRDRRDAPAARPAAGSGGPPGARVTTTTAATRAGIAVRRDRRAALGGDARPEARVALARGTRRPAALLRDRGHAVSAGVDAGAHAARDDGPRRAVGRRAARVAAVAAAALRQRLRRRLARADRAVAVPDARARVRQDPRALAHDGPADGRAGAAARAAVRARRGSARRHHAVAARRHADPVAAGRDRRGAHAGRARRRQPARAADPAALHSGADLRRRRGGRRTAPDCRCRPTSRCSARACWSRSSALRSPPRRASASHSTKALAHDR